MFEALDILPVPTYGWLARFLLPKTRALIRASTMPLVQPKVAQFPEQTQPPTHNVEPGPIKTADMQFAGYDIPNQAFSAFKLVHRSPTSNRLHSGGDTRRHQQTRARYSRLRPQFRFQHLQHTTIRRRLRRRGPHLSPKHLYPQLHLHRPRTRPGCVLTPHRLRHDR